MKLQDIVPVVVAFITLAGVLAQLRRRRPKIRESVRHDAELLALLPEESEGRRILQDHIDNAIRMMVQVEDHKTINPGGAFGAASMFAIGAGGLVALYVWAPFDAWWWWVFVCQAGMAVLGGVLGVVDELTPKHRDIRGRPLQLRNR
ncbi:hypothetical protein [Streptomyces sp. NPDC093094]|uniref:hypothetical protein n=1 Tax=Streptomyces sp. NPDC093094 TaxID=3366026 RepID=UPI003811CB9A